MDNHDNEILVNTILDEKNRLEKDNARLKELVGECSMWIKSYRDLLECNGHENAVIETDEFLSKIQAFKKEE